MVHQKSSLINKSTEELLSDIEGLEDGTDNASITDSDVYLFLRTYKIESGSYKLTRSSFYNLYKKSTISPINNKKFYIQLKYINITFDNTHVYLNKDLNELVKPIETKINRKDVSRSVISKLYIIKFEKFLNEFNIKSGKQVYIELKALYYFLDKWTYNSKKKSIPFNKFKILINTYLKDPIYLTSQPHYGVSKEFYEKVTKEDIIKAKEWAKKYQSSK